MFETIFRRNGGRLILLVCVLVLASCAGELQPEMLADQPTPTATQLPESTITPAASRTPWPVSTSTHVPSNPRRPSLAPTPGTSAWGTDLVGELRGGGYVIYIVTTESAGNQSNTQAGLENCADLSNLSDQGEFDARSLGASFLALDIPAGQVLHSGSCSSREMALLAFGREESWADSNGSPDLLRGERIAVLRTLLSIAPQSGTNTVLVGPGLDITDVTGKRYAEGETLVFKPLGKTGFSFVARILLPGWEQLERNMTGLVQVEPCVLDGEQSGPGFGIETAPQTDQTNGQFEICRPRQLSAPGQKVLLPDLITLPPTDLRIRTNPADGHKLLRFTNSIMNLGPGKMELWGESHTTGEEMTVSQYIFDVEGVAEKRLVGEFLFHPEHDHWHLGNFARYDILSFGPNGEFDTVAATSDKVSYCLRDDARGDTPHAARGQAYTNCNQERQGISVGWIDIYRYHLPGQSIDITFLYDGVYALRSTVDPEDHLWETDKTNNTFILYIEIEGNKVTIVDKPENLIELLGSRKE